MSPMRRAGRPPISTVALPFGKPLGGCGPAGGGSMHVCRPVATAAGTPLIKTFGTPGGAASPGCPVGSLMRAAGGMQFSSVDLHQRTVDAHYAAGGDVYC